MYVNSFNTVYNLFYWFVSCQLRYITTNKNTRQAFFKIFFRFFLLYSFLYSTAIFAPTIALLYTNLILDSKLLPSVKSFTLPSK